jgi:WD40 repeat protein/transcriptional regulator with XRE-family HTH domain
VKSYSYRERDYTFGQLVLTLRTAIGLSQAGLAERLGASRHAVADWEGGLSYPKAERLQQLIALGMQQQAFPAGREEEEIRALWKAAHQKVWLDEAWLHDLLAPLSPVPRSPRAGALAAPAFAESASFPRVNLVEALDVSHFAGREVEVAELSAWILEERCRVVTLLGMGGIGKSMLASLLGNRLAPHFEAVLWRSVRDAPPCEELVADCLTFFSQTPPAAFPTSLEQRIKQLVTRLQASRCLLVLDNFDTLLQSSDPEGSYLPGYEGYGRLIARLAESAHQSCVLLTSREKPREIEPLEGSRSPVRSLRLGGLDEPTAQALLSDKGLSGTPAAWQHLVAGYAGNPLALKIVAQTIFDLFGGDLDRFLEEGELIFNGVRPVLCQQVGRLSPLEHLLLTWLAVLREWTPLDTLVQVLHPRVLRAQVLEALEALSRRSLVERGQQASFGLQSVVMEYLTGELGERFSKEIARGDPQRLRQVALAQAQAKDYVRESQVRLLVQPLLERLHAALGANAQIEAHLLRLLAQFRTEDAAKEGYGPANVLTLLTALRGHLRGLDLSQLFIRGASLQGVELQDTVLAGALLQDCAFTEPFDAIASVAVSRSGHYWAAASRRGEVRVWRVEQETGERLHLAWRAHTDVVRALAFSPDEHTLASGSPDGSVKLWDVESGRLLWSDWQTSAIICLAFSPDGRLLASGGQEVTMRLWDAKLGTPLQDMPHPGMVFALAWSPDGSLLAGGDVAGTIRLWERQPTRPARCVQTLSGHTNLVSGLAFAPDGRTLASASWDGTVKLWERGEEGSIRLRQRLLGHTERVICLDWSPDGATLASGSFDHTIRLWEAQQGRSRLVLQGHTAVVNSLAFTPDSRYLLSGSEDGTLRLWEVERGQVVRVLEGYTATLYDLDWSPDGMQIASAGSDTLVSLWKVTDRGGRTPRDVLRGHGWIVYGVSWRPDGGVLASSGWDNAIRLWDGATGRCLEVIRDPDHSDNVFWGVAWSPDGKQLASATLIQGVLLWEGRAGALRWIGRELPIRIRRLAWSPDGTRLVGGADDGHIYVWDAKGGTLLQRLVGHDEAVMSVAWSPDGNWLASAGGGREGDQLFVWEVQSGERHPAWGAGNSALAGHRGASSAVAWHRRGEVLISGGSDGRLRWWEVASGQCVRVREAHQGTIHAIKVSSDGSKLASCGDDGAIMLWDLEGGEHLRTLRRDRPYERLDITGIRGLTQAEIATLRALGAVGDAAPDAIVFPKRLSSGI